MPTVYIPSLTPAEKARLTRVSNRASVLNDRNTPDQLAPDCFYPAIGKNTYHIYDSCDNPHAIVRAMMLIVGRVFEYELT